TCSDMQGLWSDFHALGLGVDLYGESVADVDCCRAGCADYANIALYAFTHGGYDDVVVTRVPGGIDFSNGFTTNETTAIAHMRDSLRVQGLRFNEAPAAPNGTHTRAVVLMQTSAQGCCGADRMPTAAEMLDFWSGAVRPNRDVLGGMAYY